MSVYIKTTDAKIKLRQGESLLEALERSGYQPEYQCRRGYCGACRLRMRHGSVHYEHAPLPVLEADEILPCCCHPDSDLEIDIHRPAQTYDPFRNPTAGLVVYQD